MTCDQCGRPAVRTVLALAYCDGCAHALLDPIRRRVAEREAVTGHGAFVRWRHDHGPGFALLACPCGASWVGYPDEVCDWCVRRRGWNAKRAHDDALRPPEFIHPASVALFAQQLRHAERDGLITDAEVRRAIGQLSGNDQP